VNTCSPRLPDAAGAPTGRPATPTTLVRVNRIWLVTRRYSKLKRPRYAHDLPMFHDVTWVVTSSFPRRSAIRAWFPHPRIILKREYGAAGGEQGPMTHGHRGTEAPWGVPINLTLDPARNQRFEFWDGGLFAPRAPADAIGCTDNRLVPRTP
jgi:hypothetical protein